MDGLKVLEITKKINPWFKTGKVPDAQLEKFKRREFNNLKATLAHTDMATLIIGARRVGKSVLMYQLIDSLLQEGVEGRKVLFIQGDNPILNEFQKEGKLINTILDLYQKYVLDKTFDELNETVYVFIDEAQSLEGWEIEVKSIIDLKYKIKFVITGSSSFELRRGGQNPLTGRATVQPISPFSFSDFCGYFLDVNARDEFLIQVDEVSKGFKDAVLDNNSEGLFEFAQKSNQLIGKFSLERKFDEYLFLGGFPWVLANNKGNDISKYLRDLLTTTISKDILTQVEIRDTQSFERLMVNLCLSVGLVVKYKTLSDALGIDDRSVFKYIDYYIESHWVFMSSPYVFHQKADSVRSEKKFYIIDNGIINTLSFKDENDIKNDNSYKGHLLENTIHNHLIAFKQSSLGIFQSSIGFWVEPESRREIDFVLETKNGVLPIEVKQKVSHDGSDLNTLKEFMAKRSSAKSGIITTQDTLKIEKNILCVPYAAFSLAL